MAMAITCKHTDRKHFGKGLCKPCYMTAWIKEHPDANSGAGWLRRNPDAAIIYKRRRALKKHGMTPEDYAALWTVQQGRCANPRCSATAELEVPDHRLGLQVDHDHKTGERRGLLCPLCNLALGCVQDDVERLRGLIEYLRRKSTKGDPCHGRPPQDRKPLSVPDSHRGSRRVHVALDMGPRPRERDPTPS